MAAFGQEWVSKLVTQRLSGRPGLNRRTGNLARSFKSRAYMAPELGGVALDVEPEGPGSEYVKIHEFGGTIKPKHSKFLWIPIAKNLTPDGVARMSPTQAIATGNLFIQWNKGPTAFMRRKMARGWRLEPMFALRKSVTIPARMGARSLWASSIPSLTTRLDAVASRILQEAA